MDAHAIPDALSNGFVGGLYCSPRLGFSSAEGKRSLVNDEYGTQGPASRKDAYIHGIDTSAIAHHSYSRSLIIMTSDEIDPHLTRKWPLPV